MKWLLPVLCIAAGPAYAQSPDLESTCMAVARNFFMVNTLNVGVVQSFPEIEPPGARFKYAERADTKKADMTDTFECEFDKTSAPKKILRFCVSRIATRPTKTIPCARDDFRKCRFSCNEQNCKLSPPTASLSSTWRASVASSPDRRRQRRRYCASSSNTTRSRFSATRNNSRSRSFG